MFHKLTEKGINIPFSYIMNCTLSEYYELCIVYDKLLDRDMRVKKFVDEIKNEVIEEIEKENEVELKNGSR